jgi:hypothetical protein
MEAEHMFASGIIDNICLEATRAHRVDRLERIADAEQVFVGMERLRLLDQRIEAFHVVVVQPHGEAQLLQRAGAAGFAQGMDIDTRLGFRGAHATGSSVLN